MAIYRYPPEVHEFVKKWATQLRDDELADACNKELGTSFTASSMKAFRGNHGYRNHKKNYSGEEYWKHQKRWPQGMFEYIRDNSWGVSSREMAERVNKLFGTDFNPARMKVFRAKYKIRSGVTGWYQKGHAPGNKGKKQEEYMSGEAIIKARKTQFKSGHRPPNELPVGSVVFVGGYLLRKKQESGTQWERWEFLHRAVWEEHHGPIPEGMVVTFRDSNPKNCSIENLMLITRGEAAALTRKGYRFEDPDLTDAALAVVRLSQGADRIRKKRRRTS